VNQGGRPLPIACSRWLCHHGHRIGPEVMELRAQQTPPPEEACTAQPGVVALAPFERAVNEHRSQAASHALRLAGRWIERQALEAQRQTPRQQQQRIETTTAAGIAKHQAQ